MKESKNNGLEEYLYKEVSNIVDNLFQKLKENDINVELERSELTENKRQLYIKIYNEYEEQLIKLREEAMLKYNHIENFDYIFATIIQKLVSKKQEL